MKARRRPATRRASLRNGATLPAHARSDPRPAIDELDSHMYQSVGHELIEAYAQCLDVPLYRVETHGRAHCTALRYSAPAGDEVDALATLLRDVCAAQPDVRGVAVGTILSDYQRVRVEHVCRQLGLVPLAYLWQREQKELVSHTTNTPKSLFFFKFFKFFFEKNEIYLIFFY